MQRFTKAIEDALTSKNWHAALALALTLPDICGHMDSPLLGSGERYKAWWDKYVIEKYTRQVGPRFRRQVHVFLNAGDAYALRCAYLHQGGDNVSEQSARETLLRFRFIAPRVGSFVHLNQNRQTLQLQVDVFCIDICKGVDKWLMDVKDDARIQSNMQELLKIEELSNEIKI